jgi:putative membrane protein
MKRRHLLVAGVSLAAAPALLRPGHAQTVTDADVPTQMGVGAAGGTSELVVAEPGAMEGIDPDKHAMITLGNMSKHASQLAIGMVQSQPLRQFATLEIAEQEAIAQAFGVAGGPMFVTPEQAEMLVAMKAGMTDGAYLAAQIDVHRQALAVAQGYAETGADPMARGAALVAVPSIESHVAMLALIRDTSM